MRHAQTAPANAIPAAPAASPASGDKYVAPSTSTSVDPNDGRSSQMRGDPLNKETVPGGALMVAAYALVWVLLLAFVVRIFTRQSAVAASLDALDAAIRGKSQK